MFIFPLFTFFWKVLKAQIVIINKNVSFANMITVLNLWLCNKNIFLTSFERDIVHNFLSHEVECQEKWNSKKKIISILLNITRYEIYVKLSIHHNINLVLCIVDLCWLFQFIYLTAEHSTCLQTVYYTNKSIPWIILLWIEVT